MAFLNRRTDGTPSDVAVTLRELGLSYPGGYNVEVFIDLNIFLESHLKYIPSGTMVTGFVIYSIISHNNISHC